MSYTTERGLRAEIERLTATTEVWNKRDAAQVALIEALRAKLARWREALEMIAGVRPYPDDGEKILDHQDIARGALEDKP